MSNKAKAIVTGTKGNLLSYTHGLSLKFFQMDKLNMICIQEHQSRVAVLLGIDGIFSGNQVKAQVINFDTLTEAQAFVDSLFTYVDGNDFRVAYNAQGDKTIARKSAITMASIEPDMWNGRIKFWKALVAIEGVILQYTDFETKDEATEYVNDLIG